MIQDDKIFYRYAKKLKTYERDGNTLTLSVQDQTGDAFSIAVSFFENGIFKVRMGKEIKEPFFDFVNPEALKPLTDFDLRYETGMLAVMPENLKLSIGAEPFSFVVQDSAGRVIYQENFDDVNPVGEGKDRIPPMGYQLNALGEISAMRLCARLRHDEHIYGLGERFTEFDRRGQKIVMKNTDTLGCRDETAYKNIPFYVSTYGYGLFLNTHVMSEFDVGNCSVSSISLMVPAPSLEFYLFAGGTIQSTVSSFMQMTGPAVLPPDWSFGLWYSTGFKGNSREAVLADADRFRKEDIPCDVMHFDCYWLRDDMWCDFVWNDALYPDRVEMLRILKEQGFKSCLWINPYVTVRTEMFQEGREKGYFVKNQDGSVYTGDLWHGLLSPCAIVDFTCKEAAAWYQSKIRTLLAEGVDAVKTDFGEDIPREGVFANGKSGAEMRNLYAYLYNQAAYEITCEVRGKEEAVVWARSGFAGMQKFPVCWSGDTHSSFEGMASALRGGLSLSLSGVPFWSHDMGGFYGEVAEEVFVRWSQFGLFSSHCRLHGTTTRQPWAYGQRAQEILKNFLQLRYRLMPYILKTARQCVSAAVPFVRPLVMAHPRDPAVAHIWDEYYFGEDLLVAPVFGGDGAVRQVYLPEGDWKDFLTGRDYEGKAWHSVICPLDSMPVFVRNNAAVPMTGPVR